MLLFTSMATNGITWCGYITLHVSQLHRGMTHPMSTASLSACLSVLFIALVSIQASGFLGYCPESQGRVKSGLEIKADLEDR